MRPLVFIWLLWFGIVLFVSFPWIGFTARPQWDRLHWVPFSDPADKPRDVILNGLLFVPVGFAVSRRRAGLRAMALAAVMAASISVPAEATQLFSVRRYPSATDVLLAILGALAGAISTLWIRGSSKPRTWTD
jgi:glycopeptide antibiotics resistance protein